MRAAPCACNLCFRGFSEPIAFDGRNAAGSIFRPGACVMQLTRGARWTLQTAALLALVGWAFIPSVARASCGDDLVEPKRSGHESESASTADAQAVSEQPMSPWQHERPCHGPHCSRDRVPLSPLAPTTPPSTVKEWSCPPALPVSAGLEPSLHSLAASILVPARPVKDIFHPPRFLRAHPLP